MPSCESTERHEHSTYSYFLGRRFTHCTLSGTCCLRQSSSVDYHSARDLSTQKIKTVPLLMKAGLHYKRFCVWCYQIRSFSDQPNLAAFSLTPGPMVGDMTTLFRKVPFRAAGLALTIASISVWKLSLSCSSVKEALPIGT